MRYQDIIDEYAGFDPLTENITTSNLTVTGTFPQDSTMYISVNENSRVGVRSDDRGELNYIFDSLNVGDVISIQIKGGSKYIDFWQETIRE